MKYRVVSMRELIITQGGIGLIVISAVGLVTFFNHCHEFDIKNALSGNFLMQDKQVALVVQSHGTSISAESVFGHLDSKTCVNSNQQQRLLAILSKQAMEHLGHAKVLLRVSSEVMGYLQDMRNVFLRNSRAGPPFGNQFYCPPCRIAPQFSLINKSINLNKKFLRHLPTLISKVSEV